MPQMKLPRTKEKWSIGTPCATDAGARSRSYPATSYPDLRRTNKTHYVALCSANALYILSASLLTDDLVEPRWILWASGDIVRIVSCHVNSACLHATKES